MRDTDHDAFVDLLDTVCGLLSRGAYRPSATNTALWFRVLAEVDLATVRAAFDAHVRDPQRGRFVPVPADILAQIQGAAADDGRPGAEEAWAMLPMREDQSTVWTTEMSQAFGAVVRLIDAGDHVAGRMAFRETYTRLVEQARRAGQPCQWHVSLGHDPRARDDVLTRAVAAGRIPLERAREYAPELLAPPRGNLTAIAGAAVQRLQ